LAGNDRRTRAVSRVLPHAPRRFVSDERLVALARRGDRGAFESLYDQHVAELLSFCYFMLASREDAEDAVQSTFAAAYRAMLRDERSIDVRPWLFAIARNTCIGILRKRRPREAEVAEQGVRPVDEDVLAKVERRESVRQMLSGMLELPERHRSALILAELHGQSQSEIGRLLGVSPSTVKSYIFQARATLASERVARETDCREIREELADARGAALLRGRLRRHLRSCAGCREYAHHVSRRRRELGALLPLLPSLALKRRVLDATAGQATSAGACGAGAGATLGGALELGGAKTLLAKVLIAATGLGAGAGAGTLVLGVASSQPVAPAARLALASSSAPGHRVRSAQAGAGLALVPGARLAGGAPAASPGPGGRPDARRPKSPGTGQAHAQQSARDRAVAAASGDAGAAGKGNGKASGNSSQHGNSAAVKGKSAEHRHSTEHGNSGSHGNSGGRGKSSSHGSSGTNGNSADNGRAVGPTRSGVNSGAAAHAAAHTGSPRQDHGSRPASGGAAGNGQGQGRAFAGASGGQPNGNGQASAGPQGAASAGAGAHAGGGAPSAQPPSQGLAEQRPQEQQPGGAKPSPSGSDEHVAPGAGAHEAPSGGCAKT